MSRTLPEWLDAIRAESDALRMEAARVGDDLARCAARELSEALTTQDIRGLFGAQDMFAMWVQAELLRSIVSRDPRECAITAAMEESRESHERANELERAAWITGSETHRREAERARAWAEFHARACRARVL